MKFKVVLLAQHSNVLRPLLGQRGIVSVVQFDLLRRPANLTAPSALADQYSTSLRPLWGLDVALVLFC